MQLLLMLSLIIDLCSLVCDSVKTEVPVLLTGIMPESTADGAGVWIL